MEFVVIDFETANASFASICQVGIATFRDGEPVELWSSLVNPEDEFSPVNISIHGIKPSDVIDSPKWDEILPEIKKRIESKITVSHTAFDRVAFQKACEKYDEPVCECRWLNSARVVRRVWKEFSRSGYGLGNVAQYLDISYQAHDALEDARCAGIVLLRAMQEAGKSLDDLFSFVEQPIWAQPLKKIHREANSEGELSGEVLVFTGSLFIPRSQAADMAASLGCSVDTGVTKRTTILVVGNQDIRHLGGKDKSSKHIKAETLIAQGQPIRILCEDDFASLVKAT